MGEIEIKQKRKKETEKYREKSSQNERRKQIEERKMERGNRNDLINSRKKMYGWKKERNTLKKRVNLAVAISSCEEPKAIL